MKTIECESCGDRFQRPHGTLDTRCPTCTKKETGQAPVWATHPNQDPNGASPGRAFFEEIYAVSQSAVDLWGQEPERWIVVEEGGEFLDTFAKLQRGRGSPDKLASEAADRILTTVHACAVEGVPAGTLWKQVLHKLGRTKTRVGKGLATRGSPEPAPQECYVCGDPVNVTDARYFPNPDADGPNRQMVKAHKDCWHELAHDRQERDDA